ncbi:phage baseplate protein [Phascolarctobacterium succinatutens]|uniref:phage baseplate protein n=1 Tax=Phascolarctobacterium succinatutens TaxID=626940 RepID=UPI0026ED7F58|nr:hypothetical protein [Phascolarctobacterium succinatutens]
MAVGDTFVMDEQDGKTVNRIDKKDTWEAVNPVLGIGEIGIEKDGMLKNIKIGDGQTAWNALGYTFKQCPYEVGDIYMTTSSVTPATRWPGTQWEVFAPGRVLIGAGTGKDSRGESKTFAVGDTGGEYQHQLTTGELPHHNHWITPNCAQWASAADRNAANNNIAPQIKLGGDGLVSGQDGCFFADRLSERVRWSGYAGNNASHNIVQPYNTVHVYLRIN